MSRTLRPPAVLAMAALIGVISAGCRSNAGSETGTAGNTSTASSSGSGNGTGTPSIGAINKLTARDKAVKLAECIRAHGVSDFPDRMWDTTVGAWAATTCMTRGRFHEGDLDLAVAARDGRRL